MSASTRVVSLLLYEDAGVWFASEWNLIFEYHWLTKIRADEKVIARKGLRAVFFSGGNSACRGHIHQHYDLYAKKCLEKGIPEHYCAVPPRIAQAHALETQKAGNNSKVALQGHGFETIPATGGPSEFSKSNILEHTTRYIICTDQVSMSLSKESNCYLLL